MRITLFNLRRSGATEEELSAYIDGSLDAASRARIDGRLAKSEALRTRLEALRATVALLRSAEPLQAPRSFALSPAMAYGPAKPVRGQGFGRISPLMPAMAAAAAALALGLLLVGNLTGSLRQSGRDTRKTTELSIPAQGAMPTQAFMATQGAMLADSAVPVGTVVVEKELSRAAAVPVTTIEVSASPTAAPAPTAFKAAQATAGAEPAPPMMAAELSQATSTPAPIAPAGPQSATAPAVSPVKTPIAAEKAVVADEAGPDATSASDGQRTAADAGGIKSLIVTTEQPADLVAVPGTPQESPESGLRLPLWQLEAVLAALAAVLGAVAVAVAVQQRRRSP